ncbi:MAG: hypothetical protein ACREQ3_21035, partial [Candidatus Binatia bacterium]
MPATADTTISAPIRGIYGQLPLGFEANHGQVDRQVQYLARGQGYSLFLTPGEAVLALRPAGTKERRVDPETLTLTSIFPSPLMGEACPERSRRGQGEGVYRLKHDRTPPLSHSLPRGERGQNALFSSPLLNYRVVSSHITSVVVRMQVVGANPAPQVEGQDTLPGKVNYFLGNDPTQWRTDISTY